MSTLSTELKQSWDLECFFEGAAARRGWSTRSLAWRLELLRDTGRATVEDLARRHLGADLTKPDFWLTGVNLALADVDEFLSLTK